MPTIDEICDSYNRAHEDACRLSERLSAAMGWEGFAGDVIQRVDMLRPDRATTIELPLSRVIEIVARLESQD